MENYKWENAGQKKRYKGILKASLKDFNRVVGTDCRGSSKVARPHKHGCWLIRSKTNRRSRAETCSAESHHQQSFLPLTSLVPSATGSLVLRLVSSAILKHTNSSTSCIWLKLVIVNNDRQTIILGWLYRLHWILMWYVIFSRVMTRCLFQNVPADNTLPFLKHVNQFNR